MNYLLDTDTCSHYLRQRSLVTTRCLQNFGHLQLSTITVAELYTWVLRKRTATRFASGLNNLLQGVEVIDVDLPVAQKFGELRAELLDRGRPVPEMDLLIGATAIVYDLILVTHNVQDYEAIPGFQVVDWLID